MKMTVFLLKLYVFSFSCALYISLLQVLAGRLNTDSPWDSDKLKIVT